MRRRNSTPVTIRGVTYADAHAAGAALGISHKTVLAAIRDGKLATCGSHRFCMDPVTIRGTTYPTIKAAAEALGVKLATANKAKAAGRLQWLGLGTGVNDAMPVRIRGVEYPTARHAAAALGVSQQAIWSGLARGSIDRVGLGVDYKARRTLGGKPKAVVVAGKPFKSMAELARFIGRRPCNVRVSLQSGEEARGRIIRAVLARVAEAENKARAERLAERTAS